MRKHSSASTFPCGRAPARHRCGRALPARCPQQRRSPHTGAASGAFQGLWSEIHHEADPVPTACRMYCINIGTQAPKPKHPPPEHPRPRTLAPPPGRWLAPWPPKTQPARCPGAPTHFVSCTAQNLCDSCNSSHCSAALLLRGPSTWASRPVLFTNCWCRCAHASGPSRISQSAL